jgi:hypothetical protein
MSRNVARQKLVAILSVVASRSRHEATDSVNTTLSKPFSEALLGFEIALRFQLGEQTIFTVSGW